MYKRDDFRFFTQVKIRFYDFDLLQHLNHTAYLILMEEARIEYIIKTLGLSDASEIPFFIKYVETEYLKPILWGDKIDIGINIENIGNTSLTFIHGIFRGNTGELFSWGRTVHVMVDRTTGKPIRIPAEIGKKIKPV